MTADPIDVFAAVARSLAEQDDLSATLQRIVDLAVATVPGAQHAAVSKVVARRSVETVASTGALPEQVDAVQYETGQGPCLDAIWEQDVVRIDDLAATPRWPEFSARAVELGIGSMLCFRLFVEEDTSGALNLFAPSADAFDEDAERIGSVFAAHAGLAWDHAQQVDGLTAAVASRTLIGQAQGILMGSRRVTADEAFALLRRASQHSNRKLRDVARDVVDTGTIAEA